jgi:hypothetical protein
VILPPLTSGQVLALADYHIRHFTRMEGRPGVREDERCHYLRLWRAIHAKGGQDLAPFEQTEVTEAVMSGDFDESLGLGPGRGT